MKNVLITGGAGKIGLNLLNELIKDKDCNITVLDLKSSNCVKRLKPFVDKIEIVYGDINNQQLMKNLIKKHDYIIHLAAVTPPLANSYNELCEYINTLGTQHICDLIETYNPTCKLIFTSSIIKEELDDISDNYTKSNIKSEDYISHKIENYIILRLQPVLFPKSNIHINCRINEEVQFLNIKSVVNILVDCLKNYKNYNNKVVNVTGNEKMIIIYSDFVDTLKKINKIKYHRANNEKGYITMVSKKNKTYQSGSLNDFFKECEKQ